MADGRALQPSILRRITTAIALMLLVLLAVDAGEAHAVEIDIALSEDSRVYNEVADVLRQQLSSHATVRVIRVAKAPPEPRGEEPELVIAVGTRALAQALALRSAPVLSVLVPRASFDKLVRNAVKPRLPLRTSAVFIDQPFSRQLNLLQLVLPGKQRIGVLASPEFEDNLKQLQGAAQQQSFTVVSKIVASPQGLYPALARVLNESDLVLATPDPVIFNAGTIQNILLTTYRAQQPLIGFSPAYVRAGALAALFSTPQQMAEQAAEMALRSLYDGGLPPPQYPRAFNVDVNATVARSLGLGIEEGAVVASKLAAMERER